MRVTPTTGGALDLVAQSQSYAVAAVDALGRLSALSNVIAVGLGPGRNANLLTWNAVPGAVKYRIFRAPDAVGNHYRDRYFEVNAPATTWTDVGDAGAPSVFTQPTWFVASVDSSGRFSGDGVALTSLNASSLSEGTVPGERLDPDLAVIAALTPSNNDVLQQKDG